MPYSRLSERRAALVELSDAYREQIAEDLAALSPNLQAVEKISTGTRYALRYVPLLVGLSTALLVWKRPRGIAKLGKTALSLWHFCAPARPWVVAAFDRWREHRASRS